jgi:hypothetical protein
MTQENNPITCNKLPEWFKTDRSSDAFFIIEKMKKELEGLGL